METLRKTCLGSSYKYQKNLFFGEIYFSDIYDTLHTHSRKQKSIILLANHRIYYRKPYRNPRQITDFLKSEGFSHTRNTLDGAYPKGMAATGPWSMSAKCIRRVLIEKKYIFFRVNDLWRPLSDQLSTRIFENTYLCSKNIDLLWEILYKSEPNSGFSEKWRIFTY